MAQCVAYGFYLLQKVSNMVLGFFPPYVYSAIPWAVYLCIPATALNSCNQMEDFQHRIMQATYGSQNLDWAMVVGREPFLRFQVMHKVIHIQ